MTDNAEKTIFAYAIPPVSYWHGWVDLRINAVRSIFPDDMVWKVSRSADQRAFESEVDRVFYEGRKLAEEKLGYQGDVAAGPYLSLLPASPLSIPIVAWMSAERGITFIASAVPLPHLEIFAGAVTELRAAPEPEHYDFDLDGVPF